MALTHKSRRRWSLAILLIGLPLYILVAWGLVGMLERPNVLIELAIYASLGVLWALPFKAVFKGVGKGDPDAPED